MSENNLSHDDPRVAVLQAVYDRVTSYEESATPETIRAELDEHRLYLDLGRRLGMLHAQMDRGTVKSATLRYRGEVAHKRLSG